MDFWSRRKAAVKAEEDRETAELEAKQDAANLAALEEKSDQEILAELNLPDPETLGAEDDFTQFLSKAVPERLRRRALRKLWLVNPALANLDGLVDYGEDFTDASMVVENLQTAYQVGKGMLDHVRKMQDEAEAALDPDKDDASAEPESGDAAEILAADENTSPDTNDSENRLTEEQKSSDAAGLPFSEIRDASWEAETAMAKEAPPETEDIVLRPGKRMRFS